MPTQYSCWHLGIAHCLLSSTLSIAMYGCFCMNITSREDAGDDAPSPLFLCRLRSHLIGVGVRVIDQLDRGLRGIHCLVPGLLAHFPSCVLHGLCDRLLDSGKVSAQEAMVVLDDIT